MQFTWMLDWEGAAAAGAAVCGGKGWNLGRLDRYGFPVPAGGVLVAEAYNRLLDQDPVRKLSARDVTSPAAVQLLMRIRQAIEETELPPDVRDDLQRFLTEAGLANRPVAVRSSATAEDGVEHSFAGIHQSFLGVRGLPAVIRAVRRCYASLWTPRAVAYRHHRGINDEAVACAAVICAMVTRPGEESPAAAGVAFSCDPRTGRRDLVTISAAPGLGEAVVSGSVNPEEISVRKGEISLVMHARGGRSDRVLTDDQALALARLTERVHWALGDGQEPQDVEWAFDGERFWLLQARPVTRLPRVTFSGVKTLPVIWSNANLKDAVPGVQSTLSWSLIKPTISDVTFSHLPLAGYPVPMGLEVLRRFSGRAYFDLTAMQWAMYDALGYLPAEFTKGLGRHQPLIPVPSPQPLRGPQGRRRQLARLRLFRGLRRQMKELPGRMAAFREAMRQMRHRDPSHLTSTELLASFSQRELLNRDFGPRFQAANMNAGLWTNLLMDLLGKFASEWARAIASALLAGSGKVTSAEHGYRLFELADAARTDAEAAAYLTRRPLDPQGWRCLPSTSPFRRELERFLDEFGHRGVYEAELANPRWNEDPTYLLEQVRYLLESGSSHSPREMARAARTAGEVKLARLPWYVRPLVRWLAGRAREAAALREAAKSAFAALAEPGRREFPEIGRRLVAAGQLDDPADVFHLAWADVEMYLREEWDGTGARALVADRKARDAVWLAEEPADVYILDAEGHPAVMPGQAEATPAVMPGEAVLVPAEPAGRAGEGNVLAGIGVAAGLAIGAARVIRHPSESHLLQDGDVLVAPSTDPGWTPLFLRAGAVVMEVGGYLSHGAIVAREYGLPAVVNIPGLLRTVRSGQRLVVDGDAGTVTILSE